MAEESQQQEAEEVAAAGPDAAAGAPERAADEAVGKTPQDDVELLLDQAQQALGSIDDPVANMPAGAQAFRFKDFVGTPASTEEATLQLMQDVELDLKIELGRTHMELEEVLRLTKGAVVPLDKMAGDPVDIYVNGRLIACGEVLVLNDNFCVRVTELVAGDSAA